MHNHFFILFFLPILSICMILDFTSVSAVNNDDGFFSVNPEDYYNIEGSEGE